MGIAEVDPLAVLPITAAAASATFARATDAGRDLDERQEQLRRSGRYSPRSVGTSTAANRQLRDWRQNWTRPSPGGRALPPGRCAGITPARL